MQKAEERAGEREKERHETALEIRPIWFAC